MSPSPQASRDEIQSIVDQLATVVQQRYSSATHDLVTHLAVRFGCERVSLGWLRGTRVSVQAISHTDRFDPKSRLVRSIAHAMEEAVDQQTTLIYPQVDRSH